MAGKYAVTTTVSVESTKAEIETVLRRYGATAFASGWDSNQQVIQFDAHERRIRMILPVPRRDDPEFTTRVDGRSGQRKALAPAVAEKNWEQACRSSWRSLLLLIKATLEAVEAEIVLFEDAFLPYIMLPNGKTVAEQVQSEVTEAYASGQVTARPMLAIGRGR